MSRFWKIALIVIAVIVVVALGFRLLNKPAPADSASSTRSAAASGKSGKDGKPETPPVPVTVVPVAKQNVPVFLTALGTVQALNKIGRAHV